MTYLREKSVFNRRIINHSSRKRKNALLSRITELERRGEVHAVEVRALTSLRVWGILMFHFSRFGWLVAGRCVLVAGGSRYHHRCRRVSADENSLTVGKTMDLWLFAAQFNLSASGIRFTQRVRHGYSLACSFSAQPNWLSQTPEPRNYKWENNRQKLFRFNSFHETVRWAHPVHTLWTATQRFAFRIKFSFREYNLIKRFAS